MKNKHALAPAVMAVLAFLCFLFVAFCMATYVEPPWLETAVLLIPALIFTVLTVLSFKGKLGEDATWIITGILSVVLVFASFFYTMLISMVASTTESTDPKYYPKAYERLLAMDDEYVGGIFPEAVPEDAKEVSYRSYPAFLQGGEVLELTYTTTGDVLKWWETFLSDKAEWIGTDGEWSKKTYWSSNADSDAMRYQILWEEGNHGKTVYVLIDRDDNRITFYYENW